MVKVLKIDKPKKEKERCDREGKVLQIDAPEELKDPKEKYNHKRKLENLWIKMQAVLAVLMHNEYYKIDPDAHKIIFLLFRSQRKAVEGESEQDESTGEETTEP